LTCLGGGVRFFAAAGAKAAFVGTLSGLRAPNPAAR
jgi:hypothetical protein